MNDILDKLRKPFHPSNVTWKPGTVKGERALALAYADLRTYMNRLDEVCGTDWSVAYEPWGDDRIICRLTIAGVTRSSTGEMAAQDEKNEMGGTVAEAQAFKRACAMFGLGRYLYNLPNGWADFDPATKKFTAGAKAKLTSMLVQHFRRSTEGAVELADVYAETDNQSSQSNAPMTVNEYEVIGKWHNRTEAEMWAVSVKACKNEHHAKESMEKIIAKHGGVVTKDNYQVIYQDFYLRQIQKLAAVEVSFT